MPLLQFLTPTVIKWTLIVSTVLGLYFYIGHLRAENQRLEANNIILQSSLEQEKQTLLQVKKDHEDVIKAKDDLVKKNQDLEKERRKLEDTLNGKISLDVLADRKTKLVQDAVNKGTGKVLKCFESISDNKGC